MTKKACEVRKIIGVSIIVLLCLAAFSPIEAKASDKSLYEKLDPDIRADYLKLPQIKLDGDGLAKCRAEFERLIGSFDLPKDPSIRVYDHYIQNSDNTGRMRLRIYEPLNRKDKAPGIYWIHGGGLIMGAPEESEDLNIRFATEVGAVVVAVDYRMAPEHPYPAPVEDCYSGLKWFSDNASFFGVDNKRIAVIGVSAGGGLCAATAIMARDRKGPHIAFQMPLYPMIDDRMATPASNMDLDHRLWNKDANKFAWNAYLGDIPDEKRTSYMAAAREKDLSGLPPTYTCVGELDIFRDDTVNYVQRLLHAGVPVEFHLYPGCIHGFEAYAQNAPVSVRAINEYVRVLKRAVGTDK